MRWPRKWRTRPCCAFRSLEIFCASSAFKALMTLCRGEDWLLYSSDWPHATFDPLNWVFNAAISEQGRRKILSENARAWIPRLA